MERKVCVITGANSGIGKVTATEMAKMGMEVLMLVRDSVKSQLAYEEIRRETGSEYLKMMYVDLASFDSIRRVSEAITKEYSQIDILINNAGLYTRKESRSVEGFELTMAVNYFAPVLLIEELLPLIMKAPQGRIINVGSELYKRGKLEDGHLFSIKKYNGNTVYANSKLLLTMYSLDLAKKLEVYPVTVNVVHPGVVNTNIFREAPKWVMMLLRLFILKPEDGARPSLYLATYGKLDKTTGKYFKRMKETKVEAVALNENLSKELVEETHKIFLM